MTSRKIERGAAPAMCNWHSDKHPHIQKQSGKYKKKKDEKKDLTYLYSSSLISLGEIPTRQLTLNNINQTVFCFD